MPTRFVLLRTTSYGDKLFVKSNDIIMMSRNLPQTVLNNLNLKQGDNIWYLLLRIYQYPPNHYLFQIIKQNIETLVNQTKDIQFKIWTHTLQMQIK